MAAAPAANHMKTYSTVAVPGYTFEHVTCATYGCDRFLNGWTIRLDESLPAGRLRADYVRRVTNRQGWTEHKDQSGEITVFTFPAGTPCFQDVRDRRAQHTFNVGPHRRQIRQHLHLVSAGGAGHVRDQLNRRGKPETPIRTHTRPRDWIEDLAESWNAMADHINHGRNK